jgi:hypothetical protein
LEELRVPLINFAPGKMLSSLNNDIQRLGAALLLSTAMFVLGATIIDMITFICFKLLVPGALVLRIFYECRRETFAWTWEVAKPLAAGAILFWLYFPATALIGNYVQKAYLDGRIAAEMRAMEVNKAQLESVSKSAIQEKETALMEAASEAEAEAAAKDEATRAAEAEAAAKTAAKAARTAATAAKSEEKAAAEAAAKAKAAAAKAETTSAEAAAKARAATAEAAAKTKAAAEAASESGAATQDAKTGFSRWVGGKDKAEAAAHAAGKAEATAAEATAKAAAAEAAAKAEAAKAEAAAAEAAAKAEASAKAEAAEAAFERVGGDKPEKGWWGRTKDKAVSFGAALSPSALAEKLNEKMKAALNYINDTVNRMLRVVVMFIVTAVVIPVSVLAFFIKIFKTLNPSLRRPAWMQQQPQDSAKDVPSDQDAPVQEQPQNTAARVL